MPSPRQLARRLADLPGHASDFLPVTVPSHLGQRAIFIIVNLLVAVLVMSLPFLASAAGMPATEAAVNRAAIGSTSLAPVDGEPLLFARAATVARGGTITAGRSPLTVQAEDSRPIQQYTLSNDDTLWTIANFYGLSAEAIAFSNGISDPYHLLVGRQIVIPPLEGALYKVAEGDTVDLVAARFKVDPAVINDYNRLYFEPEHFAAGQIIFVQNAALPTLPPPPAEAQQQSVIARAAAPAPSLRSTGTLAWPVNGVITQYMWAGHTGVDIAAPYGSGLAASVSGVISQNGWVAVGGLHICVRNGGFEECYYHMSAAYYAVGTEVSAGQIIGAIGLTGVTTGPHVHWETKINGQFVNPLAVSF